MTVSVLRCCGIRLVWETKFMERFGNSALQNLEFSLQPLDLVLVIGKFGGADQLRKTVRTIICQK